MYKRKLMALDYATPETFSLEDEKAFKNLVVWLEDQKIRHYKIEHRSELRNVTSQSWWKTYQRYLVDLVCPIKSGVRAEELEWLLMFSVKLEYGDNSEKYKCERSANKEPIEATPKVISENSLDNLDFGSSDFVEGVNKLATLLKIEKHPDHLVTLAAISKLVSQRLSNQAEGSTELRKGELYPFEDADSGFSLKDPVLNKAAKILRLLYLHDLRRLQTNINECIVGVQSLTANPKTDTKLGQVGK